MGPDMPPRSQHRAVARRLVVPFALALTCLSAPARPSTSPSHTLEPAFNGGGGLLSSASFQLGGCLDAGLAGIAASASHTLVAGCGALAILASDDGLDFYIVTPCRVVDTRVGAGPVASGTPFPIAVSGACGVPPGAKAVAVNVTVVDPSGTGHLEAYASDTPPPALPMLSFVSGRNRANNGVVRLSSDGSITLQPFVPGGGAVHLIVDVAGYAQ